MVIRILFHRPDARTYARTAGAGIVAHPDVMLNAAGEVIAEHRPSGWRPIGSDLTFPSFNLYLLESE